MEVQTGISSSKRNLILRPYQEPASDFALYEDIAVLAMAPNGGKTEIAIDVIRRYLLLNPSARILILTHSTNVLKNNFMERLEGLYVNFEYSTNFNPTCQVHICLPQSEHLIIGKYDFLIVDEAHENYLAPRVQQIVKNISPKKQLLLTGSPAPFIKKGGYKIYTVAVNELPEEYFAKVQVELVASKYNWKKKINNNLELKKDTSFSREQTQATLDKVMLTLIERVKLRLSPEEFNNPKNFISKLKRSWKSVYKSLGKTLIVCQSIEQAFDINDILNANDVQSMVSNSVNDKDSVEIENFKNNKYDVLVVVDRAKLGYSDESLCNIIDISGSHNPIVIYQIFCRLLRGNPDMQKYYLKVTTQEPGMMDLTTACTGGALMLTDYKFLSTFDGRNLSGMFIPVLKQLRSCSENSDSTSNKNKSRNFVFPEFTNDVVDLFKNIIHNLDNPASIYKLTTLREVKAALSGRDSWSFEYLVERIEKGLSND